MSYFYQTIFFCCSKNIRLNSADCFVMKIPNKRQLQQIAFNHSSDIDFQDFLIFIKRVLQDHILFLVTDTTFASNNS